MNDTTKSVFYFPKRNYRIGRAVHIPAHITDAYPYIQTNGAEVSIITRFIQSDKTYEVYIKDDREGIAKTFPSSDFPEIGTDNAIERIMPLYIGYRGQ